MFLIVICLRWCWVRLRVRRIVHAWFFGGWRRYWGLRFEATISSRFWNVSDRTSTDTACRFGSRSMRGSALSGSIWSFGRQTLESHRFRSYSDTSQCMCWVSCTATSIVSNPAATFFNDRASKLRRRRHSSFFLDLSLKLGYAKMHEDAFISERVTFIFRSGPRSSCIGSA